MPDREVPIHFLKPNHAEWSPPTVIFLDTETRVISDGEPQVLGLRLWVGALVDRRTTPGGRMESVWGNGDTGQSLATWLCGQMVGRKTVWLYAHNLNFDLTTTRLPELMVERGWRVTDFALSDKSVWMRLGKGEKTLTLCDSWTWLPEALSGVAEKMGKTKRPLPSDGDPSGDWLGRCQSDVLLLSEAILSLMGWWDDEKLGRWTITGPACGWNAARHRMRPQSILIDPDPEGVKHDRSAVKGGRRDVTRVGSQEKGPFVYIDFENAYPTIAANLSLPCKRVGAFAGLPVDHMWLDNRRFGVIAECVVDTKTPRYPLRSGGVSWYPVGRFKTVLAGPEIAWAKENGDLISVGAGRVHKLAGAMAPWARWVMDVSSGRETSAPPVARIAAKHWGRTVIGKFGSHTGRSIHIGPALHAGWHYEPGRDRGHDCRASLIDIGGERWWVLHDQEPDNAYPAVLAWVESHVRMRLGRMLDWLTEDLWVQADTDGLLLDVNAARRLHGQGVKFGSKPRDALGFAAAICDLLQELTWPLVPRPKAMWETVDIIGPQHLMTGNHDYVKSDEESHSCAQCGKRPSDHQKLSGIRADATRDEQGKFRSRTWPGLLWQMEHGDRRGYVRPMASWSVPATTAHRWATQNGRALPVEAAVEPSGGSRIVPWPETLWADSGQSLADVQVAGLRGLY